MLRFLPFLVLPVLISLGEEMVQGQQPPRLQDLEAAAQRTLEYSERKPIRWEIAFEVSNGREILVEVVMKGDRQRSRFFLEQATGSTSLLLEIIDTDGFWYVSEKNTRYKCLPYEACFSSASMYGFLARSDVKIYDQEMGSIGEFEKMDGAVAVYRAPLDDQARSMVSAAYEQLLNLMAIAPKPKPGMEEKLKTYHDFLNSGSQVRINTRTGVIEQAGALQHVFHVRSFQKLRVVSPATFDVSDQEWEDRTGSVAGESNDWDNVILIQNDPVWKPGSKDEDGDRDFIMLNLETGTKRRVPFAMGTIGSACFSSDHRFCFVTGWLPYDGTIGVFAIDLETHEHFRLGSEPLLRGLNLSAEISPDDSLLAVLQVDYEAGPLQFRLHLVDVESGDSTQVGQPYDMAYLNWLPDYSGFVLLVREHEGQLKKTTHYICRMDLNGEVTKLCQGTQPQLLRDSGRILFEADDDLWYTCSLEGKDHQKVGDGLPKFGFLSADKEGEQILMMKFGGRDGPRPHIIDVETGDAEPIEVDTGFWAQPRW
ncbi:TolB family protein [Bremerella alba]|uniref:Uncharacterized protein n=1 Tax=Bremerella alba TaxID=980252 RepID=A0A7V8V3U8_9BACT|nr:hypothetical protein [Bremerella alba]MBA2114432.1 hypothetical protein [Bremerella alba]